MNQREKYQERHKQAYEEFIERTAENIEWFHQKHNKLNTITIKRILEKTYKTQISLTQLIEMIEIQKTIHTPKNINKVKK